MPLLEGVGLVIVVVPGTVEVETTGVVVLVLEVVVMPVSIERRPP